MAEPIVINAETREITVPETERAFGVAGERKVEVKHIRIEGRTVDGTDLTQGFSWKVSCENAGKELCADLIDGIVADAGNIEFDWIVGAAPMAYKGTMHFAVCAVRVDAAGNILQEWHSKLGAGNVANGIEATVQNIGGQDLIAHIQSITAAAQQNAAAVQALAADVAANAKIVRDNEAGIQDVHENIEAIKAAPANAKAAAASAKEARSWAVGDTASRPGEGMNNAKYYAEQAQKVSQGAVGWYETEQALQVAHPTGQNGQWAIIGTTDTIWTWDSDTSAWVDSGAQVDLSNYPTNEQLQQTLSSYPTNGQLQQALQEYPTTSEVQSMIASVAPQVMTKEFVITNTVTNTNYAEYYQAISVSGYTPVSVGYRCENADLNVYGCCLRNGMAFVGFTNVKMTNLSSAIRVTLVVTYIKTS